MNRQDRRKFDHWARKLGLSFLASCLKKPYAGATKFSNLYYPLRHCYHQVENQMSVYDEIDKAIGAHGSWKHKLRVAVDTGECESTPDKVKMDNNCSFGKWLHGRIDPVVKNSPYYKEILDLHAQFHIEAGSILELALAGDKVAANEKLKLGSKFSSLSGALTRKMKEWQAALK